MVKSGLPESPLWKAGKRTGRYRVTPVGSLCLTQFCEDNCSVGRQAVAAEWMKQIQDSLSITGSEGRPPLHPLAFLPAILLLPPLAERAQCYCRGGGGTAWLSFCANRSFSS